jgi:hypothetical protein
VESWRGPGSPGAIGAFDQALAQAAFEPQPPFEALHRSSIPLVVVAEKMKKSVQREDPKLRAFAVTHGS